MSVGSGWEIKIGSTWVAGIISGTNGLMEELNGHEEVTFTIPSTSANRTLVASDVTVLIYYDGTLIFTGNLTAPDYKQGEIVCTAYNAAYEKMQRTTLTVSHSYEAVDTILAAIVAAAGSPTQAGNSPTSLLDGDAAAAQKVIPIVSTTPFTVGDMIKIQDDTPDTETCEIASISAGVSLTVVDNLANAYTVAQNAKVSIAVSARFSKAYCYDAFIYIAQACNKDHWTTISGANVLLHIGTRGSDKGTKSTLGKSTHGVDRAKKITKVFVRGVDADGVVIYGEAGSGTDRVAVFNDKRSPDVDTLNQIAAQKLAELNTDASVSPLNLPINEGYNLFPGDSITVNDADLVLSGSYRIWRTTKRITGVVVEIEKAENFPDQTLDEYRRYEDLGIYPISIDQVPFDIPTTVSSGTTFPDSPSVGDLFKRSDKDKLYRCKEIATGTADSGSTTTTVDTERTEAEDYWNNAYINFISGLNLDDGVRLVTDFTKEGSWFTQETQTHQMESYYNFIMRIGQKHTFGDHNISKVSFYLKKFGAPTGNATVVIRKVSDNSVLGTSVESFDVSTLTTSYGWIDFTFSPSVDISGLEVRVLLEYQGGSASNYVIIGCTTPSVADGILSMYIDSWNDYGAYDVTIKIYGSGNIITHEAFPDAVAVGHEYQLSFWELTTYIFLEGSFASRPAAGVQGRLYHATDTGRWYYDNGTSWEELATSDATQNTTVDAAHSTTTVIASAHSTTTVIQTSHGTSTIIASAHGTTTVVASSHSTTTAIQSTHSNVTVVASTHSTGTSITSTHSTVTSVATNHSTTTVIATNHGTITVIATAHGTSTSIQSGHSTSATIAGGYMPDADILNEGAFHSEVNVTSTFTLIHQVTCGSTGDAINLSSVLCRLARGPSGGWGHIRISIYRGGVPIHDCCLYVSAQLGTYDLEFLTPWNFSGILLQIYGKMDGGNCWIRTKNRVKQFKKHTHGFSAQPSGHPVTTQPANHSVNTQPSSHPVSTQPSVHPVSVQPSGHPVSQQPVGHTVSTQPTGHPVTTHPTGHNVSTQPSGHTVSTQPSGHVVTTQPSGHTVDTQPSGHDVTNPVHSHVIESA